jgi:hypothetical protein
MPTQRDGCQAGCHERTPRRFEAELRSIFHEHDLDELDVWVFVISTDLEWEWWIIKRWEGETGQRLINAELKEMYGPEKAKHLRVAGFRLREKLVKVLGPEQEQK